MVNADLKFYLGTCRRQKWPLLARTVLRHLQPLSVNPAHSLNRGLNLLSWTWRSASSTSLARRPCFEMIPSSHIGAVSIIACWATSSLFFSDSGHKQICLGHVPSSWHFGKVLWRSLCPHSSIMLSYIIISDFTFVNPGLHTLWCCRFCFLFEVVFQHSLKVL